jgi:CRP-like cAMP-binding protein
MYETLDSFVKRVFPQFQLDYQQLQPFLETKKLEKGEFIVREGDICDFVGLTIEGCLRSFFLKDNKEITLFFHPEGLTFGDYESWQRQQPACFSCQAIENSQILVIKEKALAVLEDLPNGQKFLRLVVEDLAFQLRDRLLSLYRDSLEQRYLHFLKTEPNLLQRIPQHYLASHLGIEPESLSRLKRRVHERETLSD